MLIEINEKDKLKRQRETVVSKRRQRTGNCKSSCVKLDGVGPYKSTVEMWKALGLKGYSG